MLANASAPECGDKFETPLELEVTRLQPLDDLIQALSATHPNIAQVFNTEGLTLRDDTDAFGWWGKALCDLVTPATGQVTTTAQDEDIISPVCVIGIPFETPADPTVFRDAVELVARVRFRMDMSDRPIAVYTCYIG